MAGLLPAMIMLALYVGEVTLPIVGGVNGTVVGVGLPDGMAVGATVGIAVGIAVGSTVGTAVGKGVAVGGTDVAVGSPGTGVAVGAAALMAYVPLFTDKRISLLSVKDFTDPSVNVIVPVPSVSGVRDIL